MTTRYRLYTERFPNIAEITARYFDGFSIVESVGYWQGIAELSVIVEIITSESNRWRIDALREFIKTANNQQSVMLTIEPVTAEF